MNAVALLSFAALLGVSVLAYVANQKFLRGQHEWRRIRHWCGVVFSGVLFVFLEALLYERASISFTTELLKGSAMPLIVFVAGCVIGMAWEYMGQLAFDWWHYPSLRRHHGLFLVLPLFWGFFMLIMQDTYAIARIGGLGEILAALLAAAFMGLVIEGINLITNSWTYTGKYSSPIVITVGWLVLLAFTFILGFNTFFINPFGL